jgi:hypothetical protein
MGSVENAGSQVIFSERKFRRNVLNCKAKQAGRGDLPKRLTVVSGSVRQPVILSVMSTVDS